MSRSPWRIAVRLALFPISLILCLIAVVGEYADSAWHWIDHRVP